MKYGEEGGDRSAPNCFGIPLSKYIRDCSAASRPSGSRHRFRFSLAFAAGKRFGSFMEIMATVLTRFSKRPSNQTKETSPKASVSSRHDRRCRLLWLLRILHRFRRNAVAPHTYDIIVVPCSRKSANFNTIRFVSNVPINDRSIDRTVRQGG